MDNQNNKPPPPSGDGIKKTYHAINEAFFTLWVALSPELLVWASWYFNDAQLAQDLLEAAFDATISGRRPWPTNIELKRHMKDAMRSINSNRKTSESELALENATRLIDPKHAKPLEDHDPGDWYEPGLDQEQRNVLHAQTPEERYEDAEGTLLADRMAEEIFEMTTPGSLEHGVLLEARKGNHKTSEVAAALGKTSRQVQQAKRSLRLNKVRPVLAKYGLVDPRLTKKEGNK